MLRHPTVACSVSCFWQSDAVNVHFATAAAPKQHITAVAGPGAAQHVLCPCMVSLCGTLSAGVFHPCRLMA
jgi:hypothetical protein